MQEQILGVTKAVNWLLAKPALAVLAALHIRAANPEYPIPTHLAMELVAVGVAVVFFLWLKTRLSVDNPGTMQQCMEALLHNSMSLGVEDLLEGSLSHDWKRYVPMIGSIGIFVLFCNLISVVPGLESPTAQVSVPLGCAAVVFLYYHWCGMRKFGPIHYGKLFMGPSPYLAPLMVLIETFSHLARMLSLTVRLWVNMMVSELLYVIFLGLTMGLFLFAAKLNALGNILAPVPLLTPVVFIVLHIFEAFVQAFVFTILPVIYVSGAVTGHESTPA